MATPEAPGDAGNESPFVEYRIEVPSGSEPDFDALTPSLRVLFGANVQKVDLSDTGALVHAESGEDSRESLIGYDEFYDAVKDLKPEFGDDAGKISGLALRAQIGLYNAINEPLSEYSDLISAIVGFEPGVREDARSLKVDVRGLHRYIEGIYGKIGVRRTPTALAQAISRQKLMPRNTGPAILEIWEHAAKKALAAENQALNQERDTQDV